MMRVCVEFYKESCHEHAGTEEQQLQELIKHLRLGWKIKFTIQLVADLESDEMVLYLGTSSYLDHMTIGDCISSFRKKEGQYHAADGAGGYVALVRSRLIFYGSSWDLGAYDATLLKKFQPYIRKKFHVRSVSYRTGGLRKADKQYLDQLAKQEDPE